MTKSRFNSNVPNAIDGVPIGAVTPSTGAFTTLAATGGGTLAGAFTLSGAVALTGSVSGIALTNYLASPAAIGGTTPAAGTFTNLSATGTLGATGLASLNGGASVTGIAIFNGDVFVKQVTPTSKGAAATLTTAEILTGIVQYTGAAAALTFPLATALDTALPTMPVDRAIDFFVINTGTGAATMTANTGVTIIGAAAVANGTSAQWRLRKTATATYVAYRMS